MKKAIVIATALVLGTAFSSFAQSGEGGAMDSPPKTWGGTINGVFFSDAVGDTTSEKLRPEAEIAERWAALPQVEKDAVKTHCSQGDMSKGLTAGQQAACKWVSVNP